MTNLSIRRWHANDDPALTTILCTQMAVDENWPPAYARKLDISVWLSTPANLGRWVCEHDHEVVGHIGLGSMSTGKAQHFCTHTNLPATRFAELCRTVVDPRHRSLGVASMLTRTAIKAALTMRRIPVATVLTGRTTWLEMMLNTGWRNVGDTPADGSSETLISLMPPQKFVDAALSHDD